MNGDYMTFWWLWLLVIIVGLLWCTMHLSNAIYATARELRKQRIYKDR